MNSERGQTRCQTLHLFLARSTERVLSFIILLVAPGPSVQVFSYDEPLDYWLQVSVNVLSSSINGVAWVKLKAEEGTAD